MDARWFRNSFIWLIVMVFVLAIAFQVFRQSNPSSRTIPLTGPGSLVAKIRYDVQNQIRATLTIDNDTVTLQQAGDATRYEATFTDANGITDFLHANGIATGSQAFENDVVIKETPASQWGNWLATVVSFLPLLIFGAILIFMMRQAQGSNNQALSFGKSR